MAEMLDAELLQQARKQGAAAERARMAMLAAARRRQEAMLGLSVAGASVRDIAAALDCSPAVVQASLSKARKRRPPLRARENRVAYELHLAVVDKLDENPDEVLTRARTALDRMMERTRGPVGREWMDEWRRLLAGDVDSLRARMLATDEHAEDMRQVSPFLGVLTESERQVAILKARAQAPGRARRRAQPLPA